MSGTHRKVFKQQMRQQLRQVGQIKILFCPVCGSQIDHSKTIATSHGETVYMYPVSILRFQDVQYQPCGCRMTYDRLKGGVLNMKRGGAA